MTFMGFKKYLQFLTLPWKYKIQLLLMMCAYSDSLKTFQKKLSQISEK